MALIKMWRDFPEVAGGKTEAMVPEEGVKAAMDNGWKKTEDKPSKDTEPSKDVKKEVSKLENKAGISDKKEDKQEKPSASKGQKKQLRDE